MDKKFSFRCIAYRQKDGFFIGVCLDLDLVEEGHATLQEAILSVDDAILSHMKVAQKHNFPEELISRPAPKEYWDILDTFTDPETSVLPQSPFQFFTAQPEVSKIAYA